MNTNKKRHNKIRKTKKKSLRHCTFTTQSMCKGVKSKKMHGGNSMSINKVIAEMPKTKDFSDIICGTFVKEEGAYIPHGYPEGTVKGKYTSSSGKEKEDYFFHVTDYKYQYSQYGEKHTYTGYASYNPKALTNPNGESAKLQKYFLQIQGVNHYPNGDVYVGCYLGNVPADGRAKYYKYIGKDHAGKNRYKLEFDGEWKHARYVPAEPPTLQELSKAAFIKSNKGPINDTTKYVLDSVGSTQHDIPYHISINE